MFQKIYFRIAFQNILTARALNTHDKKKKDIKREKGVGGKHAGKHVFSKGGGK